MTIRNNWAGKKFGMLIFQSVSAKKATDGSFFWNALCDCGKHCLVLPREARAGHTISCGHFRKDVSRYKAGLLHKKVRKYDPYISTARAVWQTYYKECEFDIFLQLTQQHCYYCNRAPYRTYNVGNAYGGSAFQMENGNFTYNGLDRVDRNKGHTKDNVVPCCLECNQAKNDLTVNEFIDHIERMYKHTRRLRHVSHDHMLR